ncbi:hypothetical protein D3C87_1362960 [compost metagenome]
MTMAWQFVNVYNLAIKHFGVFLPIPLTDQKVFLPVLLSLLIHLLDTNEHQPKPDRYENARCGFSFRHRQVLPSINIRF